MYQGLAAYYDQLMVDFDYLQWSRNYLSLAQKAGVRVTTAIDCACGTGNLTIPFAKQGIKIIGMDRSDEMLRIAMDKTRRCGLRIPYIQQDMCALTVHRPVDAIFCGCDGVNYLTDNKQLIKFFSSAHSALHPGGGLFFDISSEYKLSTVLGNQCFGRDERDLAYMWFNHYDADKRIIQMDLTFFAKGSDQRYERFTETHFQRAHRPEELIEILEGCGFHNIVVYDENTLKENPQDNSLRLHFSAVKGE